MVNKAISYLDPFNFASNAAGREMIVNNVGELGEVHDIGVARVARKIIPHNVEFMLEDKLGAILRDKTSI